MAIEIGKMNKGEIAVFAMDNGNLVYMLSNGWQFRTVDKAIEKAKEVDPGYEPKFISFLNSGEEIDSAMLPSSKPGRKAAKKDETVEAKAETEVKETPKPAVPKEVAAPAPFPASKATNESKVSISDEANDEKEVDSTLVIEEV